MLTKSSFIVIKIILNIFGKDTVFLSLIESEYKVV